MRAVTAFLLVDFEGPRETEPPHVSTARDYEAKAKTIVEKRVADMVTELL